MNKYRSHNCSELTEKDSGKTVSLSGWLHRKRDHGNLLFIDLRDHFGLTQCVIENNNRSFSLLEKTRRIEYEANKTEQTELENKFRALHGLAPKEDKAKQDSTDIQSNEDEDETEQYDDPSYDAILVEAAYILSELNDQMTVE